MVAVSFYIPWRAQTAACCTSRRLLCTCRPLHRCTAPLLPPSYTVQATRPLAVAVHRAVSHVAADGGPLPDLRSANQLLNKRGQAAGEWDVSRMAPKLKEEQ